mgnify:CR=1 FL=1
MLIKLKNIHCWYVGKSLNEPWSSLHKDLSLLVGDEVHDLKAYSLDNCLGYHGFGGFKVETN